MNNMELLHAIMSRHVVTVKITVGDAAETYDGTVLSSQPHSLYIIASSEFRDKIDSSLIQVQSPDNRWITIQRNCFDMAAGDSGIVGIRCTVPVPGDDYGFGNLEPINICEDLIQEHQVVYTYSHHDTKKLLTPGSIMLVQEHSFDHNCVRYLKTHKGAPVVNPNGQFVGFCISHMGYLTSYNIREVAARIERNQGREFTSISVTFQHLRQQCRAINFRLRGLDVQVKIQRIGQPVTSASWESLEEFQQQHPAFQVEREIEEEIEQYTHKKAVDRFAAQGYVRRKQRRGMYICNDWRQ